MLIRYLLDVIRIKIIRSALLAEVHTYNRRYSGEPRTLMEMIRCLPKQSLEVLMWEMFLENDRSHPTEISLCCSGILCITCSVERACTSPSNSGFIDSCIRCKWSCLWRYNSRQDPWYQSKIIHSTPFLDLQPPDIHFNLDLWPCTKGEWLVGSSSRHPTSPQGGGPRRHVAALPSLPPWPYSRGCVWTCKSFLHYVPQSYLLLRLASWMTLWYFFSSPCTSPSSSGTSN